MNRSFLEELLKVIEDETSRKDMIDKIMSENGKTINASKSKIDELTEQLGLKTKESEEANKLIADLKKSNQGNEELQNSIAKYETENAKLKAENEQLKIDNAVKVELLGAKAKSDDLDYLMFKIKQGDTELTLDENGKLKGLDVEAIKSTYPSNFEVESKKVVDVNNLPKIDLGDNNIITKEQFDKMGYKEKNKLMNDNPDVYKNLKNM